MTKFRTLTVGRHAEVTLRDCNPGIPDVFLNPESRDWQSSNPGISTLKKIVFSVETSIYSMTFAVN